MKENLILSEFINKNGLTVFICECIIISTEKSYFQFYVN